MEKLAIFAIVRNRLYARILELVFCQIFKIFKKFYKKQVYSLEIEDIFAKMTKMAVLDFFARTKKHAVEQFSALPKITQNF